MTGRRNGAVSLWTAAALAAVLLVGLLALTGCAALDPDGGAALNVGKQYAPTPIKLNILDDMKVQGFSISNYNYTYAVYPSEENTHAVTVTGLMYGPSGKPGVLDVYQLLRLNLGDDGVWKVVESVKGTPAAADLPPTTDTSASAETSGSSETTAQ
jgi:hypothetical protein